MPRRKHSHWIPMVMMTALCLIGAAGCGTLSNFANGFTATAAAAEDEALLARAREILTEIPLVDGHNDVPWAYRTRVSNHLDEINLAADTSTLTPPMHTDIPRLREGGVGGQFWSVYIPASFEGPGAARVVFEQIDVVHRLVAKHSDTFELALTADDITRIHGEGKIASLIGMEGGHSIENSLAVLRRLYAAGARYMTITHSSNIDWADSGTDAPEHDGLTRFGREVIREMNRLGMLVDLSHVAPTTMKDALDASEAPIIFSHSSARGVTAHPRNVPDEILERLPANGGVVMVTFVPSFVSEDVRANGAAAQAERGRLESLHPDDPTEVSAGMAAWRLANPAPKATLADVADHIDHVRDVAGIDHIGIGSDFDGITSTPVGLEDVSTFPALLAELLRRGYSEEEVKKIAGLNLLRAFKQAEEVAARLQEERGPSDALIEELDGEGR